jgi:YfiR/HmsC-like
MDFRRLMPIRAKIFFVLLLALLTPVVPTRAQGTQPEYQVKAAFLWNFAKYIDWPPAAFTNDTSPFVIGVLGENPFGTDLEQTVRGKLINAHPITVKPRATLEEARQCHILFFSASETNRLAEVFENLRGAPVLTVGDTEAAQFTEKGGMIKFKFEGNKIRFQINDEAAKAAGLRISSKLLDLAVRPSR